jgi:hypothetical protein
MLFSPLAERRKRVRKRKKGARPVNRNELLHISIFICLALVGLWRNKNYKYTVVWFDAAGAVLSLNF